MTAPKTHSAQIEENTQLRVKRAQRPRSRHDPLAPLVVIYVSTQLAVRIDGLAVEVDES